MMISSFDFHKSGAKVRRNYEIRKDADGAGQNLICNVLILSPFPRALQETSLLISMR